MKGLTVYSLAGEAMLGGNERAEVMRMAIVGLASRPGGYVVAIDFDGTLHTGEYPEIGKPVEDRITRATYARKLGVKLVLWTCREGDELKEAVDWCWEKGIEFDAINSNTVEKNALYGSDSRKIGYDELWDDKAVDMDALRVMI